MALISQKGSAPTSHETLFSLIENIGPSILNISDRPIKNSGTFGYLYSGTHATAGKVALKRPRLALEEQDMMLFLLKTEAWRKLSHPHVLQFIGVAEIKGVVHLVSPYIANGSLLAFARSKPDAPLPRLLGETADAIAFLHEQDIIHGDIKGNSILVSDDVHALVCGFGHPRKTDPATAPGMNQLFKSDTHSFGTTITEVLTGTGPFWTFATDSAVIRAAFFEHKRPDPPSVLPKVTTAHSYVWEISQMCMVAEASARPDMPIVRSLFEQLLSATRTTSKPKLPPASQLRKTLEKNSYSAPRALLEDIGSSIIGISDRPFSQAGGFADLYSGTHATAGKVALKRPRLGQDVREIEAILQEAKTWRQLRHPHILEFIGVCKFGGIVYLVSPFISNGTLRTYLERNPNADWPRLLRETADAIVFLHNAGVIHGDLKANNVLISDDVHALLCDFGLAQACEDATATVLKGRGTIRWMSPELWSGSPKSPMSDTYSFGMTIIEVLTGKVPFSEFKDDLCVIHAILVQRRRIIRPSVESAVLSYIWDVAEMCIVAETEMRPEMVVVHLLLEQLNCVDDGSSELPLLPAPRLRDLLERARRAPGTSNAAIPRPYSIYNPEPLVCEPAAAAPSRQRVPDSPASAVIPSVHSPIAVDLTNKVERLYIQATKKGGHADVYEGIIITTGQKIAIKSLRRAHMGEMDPDSKDGQERLDKRMKREMHVWLPLKSPRIVPCVGYAYVGGMPCLVSPWYANGNAKDYIKANPDCDRRPLVMQIAEGIAYLHRRTPAIIHYNVKSMNVLIDDDGCAKLADFCCAKIMENVHTGFTTTNDQLYGARCSAPERLAGGEMTVQSDVYSFACFALEMMTGNAPFYKVKFTAAVVGQKCGGAIPKRDDHYQLDAADPLWPVMEACWNMVPEERPTMVEVLTDLKNLGFTA